MVEFSVDAVEAVEAQLRALTAESTEYKREIEAIREKRRDVLRRMEPLLRERQELYRARGFVPGDVVV